MVFLCTPAQTHNAPKSAFLLAVKGKKRSLSLSLSFSSVCVVVVVVRTHRAWCVLKAKKRKKKKTIRKNFFCARAKRHKYIAHSFRFFLSLSFSFSPVVVVVVACHHPERERERERCAHLFKNAPRLSFRETYLCVLSLCSFAAALNIFYSFSSEKVDKKKRSVVSDFSTGFFDSKSASCLPHLT